MDGATPRKLKSWRTVLLLFQSSDSGGFRARRRSPKAVTMAHLSLRISIPEKNATKMMQFDPSTSVYDACRIIREKLAEASNMGQRKFLLLPKIFRGPAATFIIFIWGTLRRNWYPKTSKILVLLITEKHHFFEEIWILDYKKNKRLQNLNYLVK